MNPLYILIQKLPTNGWTTALGALLAISYGISGMAIGHLDTSTGITSIAIGIIALGLGSKLEKVKSEIKLVQGFLPAPIAQIVEDVEAGISAGTANQAQ